MRCCSSKKSLERAATSCEKGAMFAQHMADTFRAEGQMIRSAYDALDTLVANSLKNIVGS